MPALVGDDLEAATLVRSALIEVMGAYHQLQLRERATADLRQRMLNEELNHRVKNILSVVQSLVSQPIEPGSTPAQHVARLRGRVQALGLAHDQAVRSEGWPAGRAAGRGTCPLPGALLRHAQRAAHLADRPGAVRAGAGGA
ncbi:HWE histidine kinase domain-containing protein [Komagataeibacter rhaeticus]|nr:HWE histidine kinase domain-containing protein [Komagataeibacter rhaeticus]